MNRRNFGRLLTGLGALQGLVLAQDALAMKTGPANREATVGDRNQATLEEIQTLMGGDALNIGIVMYPGLYPADVVNLATVFQSLGSAIVHLIAKDKNPVANDESDLPSLFPLQPSATFEDAPKELDVLILPGTLPGKYALLEDQALLGYVREAAKGAKIVASVGSGSLIMAAAGLLQGRKATTFWPLKPLLQDLGAKVENKRVVVDGNRVTAAGSTASLDLGLKLIELLRNPAQAQLVQLYLEYDPAPPKGGSPEKAQANVSNFMNMMYRDTVKEGREVATRLSAKLKAPKK